MQEKDAKKLLDKYISGEITDEEKALLESWHLSMELKDAPELSDDDREIDLDKVWARLESDYDRKKPPIIKLWPRVAAAASILLFLSIGGYFIFHKQSNQQTAQNQQHDIAPGSNRATLTLANGQKIILTKELSGKLAQQGNALVQVNSGNAVTYTISKSNSHSSVQYNTLSTVSGEQSPYALVLADGTKVWLNAESSITFPTSFTGKERIVKVTGEAYFEVVHNAAQPFKVTAMGDTIDDVGTHFNINAYNNEPSVNTTLLEGSVKVSTGSQNVTLVPGQQSVHLIANNKISIKDADIEDVTAWKDGYFAYKKADINTVMRQFARWYNVDVSYEGAIPTTMITGKVHRNVNASQALKILTYLDIHYRIAGKKIIITP